MVRDPKPGAERTEFLRVRIEPEVLRAYRVIVEAEHRTVSQDIRRYIQSRLDHEQVPA